MPHLDPKILLLDTGWLKMNSSEFQFYLFGMRRGPLSLRHSVNTSEIGILLQISLKKDRYPNVLLEMYPFEPCQYTDYHELSLSQWDSTTDTYKNNWNNIIWSYEMPFVTCSWNAICDVRYSFSLMRHWNKIVRCWMLFIV